MAMIDSLQVKGFGKQKLAAVVARAKDLGMSPQRYLKHLVDEDLAISQRAKSTSFEELLGPGQEENEEEIDKLVAESRRRYHLGRSRRG